MMNEEIRTSEHVTIVTSRQLARQTKGSALALGWFVMLVSLLCPNVASAHSGSGAHGGASGGGHSSGGHAAFSGARSGGSSFAMGHSGGSFYGGVSGGGSFYYQAGVGTPMGMFSGFSNGGYSNYQAGATGNYAAYSDMSYHANNGPFYANSMPDPNFRSNSGIDTHSFFWGREYNDDTPEIAPVPDTIVPSDQNTLNRSHYLLSSYYCQPAAEPLLKSIARVDEELVSLDGEGRIGTFDTDFYSEELLAIKRDYDAGISARGNISPAREAALRKQLAGLEKEIQRLR